MSSAARRARDDRAQMQRLRFALLFNGKTLERWHLRCLEQLEESADLAGVLVAPDRPRLGPNYTGSLLMRWYARRVDRASALDVTERLAQVPRVPPADAPGASAAFEFVLKLGRGPLPAETGVAARHGVWYFEHECDDDLLPFLREVYEGEDVTHAALSAAGETDETWVLEEGWFATDRRSYVANRERILESIATWPARACGRLTAGVAGDSAVRRPSRVPSPCASDRPARLLPFVVRTTRRRLDVAWERLFRHPQWNIGILNTSVEALLAPGSDADNRIEWLPLDDREDFVADPFGVERDGTLHILYERFDYRESKGHICALEYPVCGSRRQPQPAIALPVHMSYPFLLEDSGEIYCVPETSEANEVALLRADEFPHRWSKAGVLLEGFAGVDPTVFRHDGRWWLMCTAAGPRADVELWVWHAPDLLGPWTAHTRNPVKTDVRGARPAGPPFVHQGVLYRPTQDCSRRYGWRVAVQCVTRLTPTEFAEEQVTVLEASAGSPFPLGRHTFTPVGDVILVDGLRTVFVWAAFRAFLRIWGADLRRRLRYFPPVNAVGRSQRSRRGK